MNNSNSLSFDGQDDYLSLSPVDLSYSDELSIMCNINAQDLQTDEWNSIIRQDWGEPNWLLQFYDYGTNLILILNLFLVNSIWI